MSEIFTQCVSKHIYIHKHILQNPMTIKYFVECASLFSLNFTMNFIGSENFDFEESEYSKIISPFIFYSIIPPFKKILLVTLRVRDLATRAVLKLSYSWNLSNVILASYYDLAIAQYETIDVLITMCVSCLT